MRLQGVEAGGRRESRTHAGVLGLFKNGIRCFTFVDLGETLVRISFRERGSGCEQTVMNPEAERNHVTKSVASPCLKYLAVLPEDT